MYLTLPHSCSTFQIFQWRCCFSGAPRWTWSRPICPPESAGWLPWKMALELRCGWLPSQSDQAWWHLGEEHPWRSYLQKNIGCPPRQGKKIPGEIRHLIYTYSCILVYKWAGKTSAFFSDRRLFPFPRCQKPANPLRSRAPTLWRPCQVLFRWTFFSEILVTGWWNPIIIYIYITHTDIYIYIHTHIY